MEMAAQLHSDSGKSGTYHFPGATKFSWAEFAREIFRQSGISCAVTDIPSSDYPTPAARPANSRLDCTKINTVFDLNSLDCRVGLGDILTDLKASS